MTAIVMRGDAANLALPDESVDLVVTSPPYHGLRSYQDGGTHYKGQVGDEATPQEFLESLWRCTEEWARVLKPSGSMFVNLGDRYAGSGGHNNADLGAPTERGPSSYNKESIGGARPKSLMGLPWRYANGCVDRLNLILRAELVWAKRNGMPESVTDRVRRSHEQFFHLTKEGDYFSGIDEIREPHTTLDKHTRRRAERTDRRAETEDRTGHRTDGHNQQLPPQPDDAESFHPAGRLPGSVWEINTEPLIVPDWARTKYDLPDHFAAFPIEWPRRLILGWSPSAICLECGVGRFPVTTKDAGGKQRNGTEVRHSRDDIDRSDWQEGVSYSIVGYACACTPFTRRGQTGDWKDGREANPELGNDWDAGSGNAVPRRPGGFGDKVPPPDEPRITYHLEGWTPPPTRPSVVLDPFGGTGTVAMVARSLGRIGISNDLSADYGRLARWRIFESGHAAKATRRTWAERQATLL